jgi:ribosomal protein S18 acetylase RimI-like enzyme
MDSNLPPLPPGFTSRNARLEDVEMAAQLGIEYSLATTGFSDVDPESLRNEWQVPGFDPALDVYFVFSPDGSPAGFTEAWAERIPPVHPFIWGMVATGFQNQGIGSHLLAWAEARARRVLHLVPPDVRVSYYAGFPAEIAAARALLEDNAWTRIRGNYTMRIDMDALPPAPELPPGLSLRTFRDGDAEEVFRTVDESFRDHFGHVDQPFESGFERFRHNFIEDPLFDGGLWFLATEGSEIVGVALCRSKADDDPDCGYVASLGVRRPWRKRGLGLALLRAAFREFHARDYRKVSLGVDAENITGALRLYEKAGMHVSRQFEVYEKEIRPGRELRVQALD